MLDGILDVFFCDNFAKTSPILKFMLTEFFILIVGVLYIFCM